ncbi:response regulator [Paenibacillus mucilaginosus]|uniref:YesN21 n=1 Tax=Paenibacillus mucilaginosus (strain KNP414) TaxID=1036673 RepID=F8F9X5_PAEMK|nr:response regulator [Paenibacillus mucilaginosus]AEI45173.1 YesN21 [Paenibacillus mucilaginosus KNP414]MCG7212933.1 response regulator [Paenibacillus mucilaginosus]WDM26653.1 response regulator [Paenibacillus mucilaginosus]
MKVKAMLVDDEIHIVRNLEKIIPWESLGIEIIATAGNGAKALELAEELKPDLILSDIRMPVMDGIELLKQLRGSGYGGEILMLTGFQEFDYARSAVKYGAREYILKPIDYEELENILQSLAAEIQSVKLSRMKDMAKWRELSELAYEKILLDLLMDYTSFPLHRLQEEEDRVWLHQRYWMLLVDLDDYSQIIRQDERERKLVHFAVRNVLQEALRSEFVEYAVLLTREGEWCLLIPLPQAGREPAAPLEAWSEEVQEAVRRYVKLSVSVGVYPSPVSAEGLADAYKKLQRSLQLALEKQAIVLHREVQEADPQGQSFWSLADRLVAGLTQGESPKVDAALEELGRLLKEHGMRAEQMLHFLNLHLLREMRAIGLLDSLQEQRVMGELERSMSIKELMDCVLLLVRECMQTGQARRKSPEVLMATAREYIQKGLSRDLGLEELAQHLGISNSYFSLLFKQQHGETFLEYVTRERMELAKSLLLTSDKSVTQIGKLAGYAERRYFTKVFHKYEGMTPSEFRDRGKPGNGEREKEEAYDGAQ